MSSSDEDVLQFIAASFPSVWALEVLLTLKGDRRYWSRDDLIATLRASEVVVSKAIDALVVAGLASIGDDGVSYLPVNRQVEECVERVEQLYRTKANVVRRVIIAANAGGMTAFANAFRLRKDRDD